jgi:hypothetical protein
MKLLRILLVGALAAAAYAFAISYRDIVRYREMREM